MQNYISQLLSDLDAAKKNVPAPIDYALLYPDHPAFSYGLDYIVEWEMAPDYPMDDLFGIKAEQLPVDDKLSDKQVEDLVEGILDLWATFNIVADIPDDAIPPRLVYKALKNRWEKGTTRYMSEGTTHVEFCHYEPEECPWGMEFCSCKEFANETIETSEKEDNELLKGAVHHEDGSMSWVNPKFLDENGHFDASKIDDFPLPF